jgi:outer membrane receptor for ferrienterochelin and colicin
VTRGLELGTTVVPVENLTLSLNYTLLDAVDEDKDRRLPYLPQHRINGEARWKIFKGTSLFTQFNYVEDAREYIFDKMTKTESTRELPDYFIWDAGIEQKIFERATLIARVENILDEDYDIGDGPMPGRAVWAGCRVDW